MEEMDKIGDKDKAPKGHKRTQAVTQEPAGLYLYWGRRRRRPAASPSAEPRRAGGASREPSGVRVALGRGAVLQQALRGCGDTAEVKGFSITPCSLCRLSTDNKPGFTCLPRLINHFSEEFSLQLLVMAKRGFI